MKTCFMVWLAIFALTACGSEQANPTASPAADGSANATSLTVETVTGIDNKYTQESLSIKAGAISVAFKNNGSLPHNWTLVKQGEEETAAAESISNAPEYRYAGALAQSAMLNPNASETLSANLEAGTYSYLCTFPGHYALGMKGTLTVTP